MKLYALFDTMIEYFMEPPFFAENDNNAMQQISSLINNGETKNVVTQAPHHFELWRIGDFQGESGDLRQERERIIGCNGLIRRDVRETTAEGNSGDRPAAPGSERLPKPRREGTGAANGPGQIDPQGEGKPGP